MSGKLISDLFDNPFGRARLSKDRENHENHEYYESGTNKVSTTGAVSSTRSPSAKKMNPYDASVMGAARQVVDEYSKVTPTDPNGSSTGVPQAKNELPVQDADDL
jgi:hypothetical protein